MRPFTASKFAAVAAVASLAGTQAQLDTSLITSLSSGCQQSLLGLISTGDLSTCLALTDAVGTFGSTGTGSFVAGFDSYFTNNICAKAPCTNATLSAASQSISKACASDIGGGKSSSIPALILYLLSNYDNVRTSACLQDDQDKELCLVQTMYAFQNATNTPLSFLTLSGLLGADSAAAASLSQAAQNRTLLCTSCNDALLTTASMARESSASTSGTSSAANSTLAQLATGATQLCGANATANYNFTDRAIPSKIKQTATGNSTSLGSGSSSGGSGTSSSSGTSGSGSGNSAASLQVGSIVTIGLGVLATGFAVLL